MSTVLTPAMKRSVLIAALRDPTLRPEHFSWYYGSRCSCAIGLSVRMGILKHQVASVTWGQPCEEFGLSAQQSDSLFNGIDYPCKDQAAVTAEMVADRLSAMHEVASATEKALAAAKT